MKYIKRSWKHPMSYVRSLYEIVGAPYPKLTLAVACLAGAIVFGFIWYSIGRDYAKSVSAQKAASLKDRASLLSHEILEFLADRRRNEPRHRFGRTDEQWRQDRDDEMRYYRETMNQFSIRFASRAQAICSELQDAGLGDQTFQSTCEHPTNPIGIQIIGEHMGMLAQKLP